MEVLKILPNSLTNLANSDAPIDLIDVTATGVYIDFPPTADLRYPPYPAAVWGSQGFHFYTEISFDTLPTNTFQVLLMLQANFGIGVNTAGLFFGSWLGSTVTYPITWQTNYRHKIRLYNLVYGDIILLYVDDVLVSSLAGSQPTYPNGTWNGLSVGSWSGGANHLPSAKIYSMLLEYGSWIPQ